MRTTAIAVAAVALAAASAQAALGLSPLTPSLTAKASTTHPGARRVGLVLRLAYLMQCSQPGPKPIVVTFPKGEGVPGTMRPGTVLLNGKAVKTVVKGKTVTVTTPPRPRVMCDVIALLPATVTFLPGAGLRNPLLGGRYPIRATHDTTTFSTLLRIG